LFSGFFLLGRRSLIDISGERQKLMGVAIFFVVIDTEDITATTVSADPALGRGPYFFHFPFLYTSNEGRREYKARL